ncbi:MAG: CHAT domain-containing tetratricopeptide repeat protein [Bacteroidota bacterium]
MRIRSLWPFWTAGFVCLLALVVDAQSLEEKVEAFDQRMIEIQAQYFYSNPDSALILYGEIATESADLGLWHKHLESVVYMSWVANQHKALDTLVYLIDWGDRIARDKAAALDTLDADFSARSGLRFAIAQHAFTVGNFERSIDQFKQVLFGYEGQAVANDSMLAHSTSSYIGDAYYHLQHYKNANYYYELAATYVPDTHPGFLPHMDKVSYLGVNQSHLGKCLLAQSKLNNNQDLQLAALERLQRARAMLESKNAPRRLKNALAATYNRLYDVNSELGRYDSAMVYLQKNFELLPARDVEMIRTQRYLGHLYRKRGEYDKAIAAYHESFDIMNSYIPGKHYRKAEALRGIGDTHVEQGKVQEGLKSYQQALTQLVPAFDESGDFMTNPPLVDVGSEKEMLATLMAKAQTGVWVGKEENRAPDDWVLETYDLGVQLVDSLRFTFPSREYRAFLSEQLVGFYEGAMDACFQGYSINPAESDKYLKKAFYYAEKYKSRLLLEAYRNASAREVAGVPTDVLAEEERLMAKKSYGQQELLRQLARGNDAAVQALRTTLLSNAQAYDEFLVGLEESYPEYHALRYSAEVINLKTLQDRMDPQQLKVSYFYGDQHVYALGISKEKQSLVRMPVEHLIGPVRDIVAFTSKYSLQQAADSTQMARFTEAAHLLYDALVAPLLAERSFTNIQFVPDGPLGYVPFELLLTESIGAPEDYRNLPYLLTRYQVHYEYSATLASAEMSRVAPTHRYLGFAPSYDQARTGELIAYADIRQELGALENNVLEVETLSEIFGGKTFLKGEATEKNFKEIADEGSIVHLSMHAFTDDRDPAYSGFAFAPVSQTGVRQAAWSGDDVLPEDMGNDGFLFLQELYNLRMNANLAILSACETGRGAVARGEGIMSLGRAFKYAGCPNVVMSLWKANDRTTEKLIGALGKYLDQGMGKSEALRQAKLHYLQNSDKTQSHPYYWSAFILIGDDAPIAARSNTSLWMVGAFLLLLIFVFIVRRRKQTTAH